MLSHHLQCAAKDLQDLIDITESDIQDIKEARQDSQFARIALKDEKINSFESKKSMIDHEIMKLIQNFPDKDLSELLSQDEQDRLNTLKNNLALLREVNQQYAKLVLTVSSFYNSLLESLVPTEMDGYKKVTSKKPNFLEARV